MSDDIWLSTQAEVFATRLVASGKSLFQLAPAVPVPR